MHCQLPSHILIKRFGEAFGRVSKNVTKLFLSLSRIQWVIRKEMFLDPPTSLTLPSIVDAHAWSALQLLLQLS
jgi:hypothetical protein